MTKIGAIAFSYLAATVAAFLSNGSEIQKAVPEFNINPPPEYLTIVFINLQNGPISTSHASAVGAPTPIWGGNGTGTISSGGGAAMVVPTGWAGNVAIFDAQINTSDSPATNSSLIEASFVIPENYTIAVADIDVSYVYVSCLVPYYPL